MDLLNTAQLKIKIFADGADKRGILDLYRNPLIQGFTTNPTLMRQVGISDYEAFARRDSRRIPDRPFSLEVFSDDFDEMGRQARKLAALGRMSTSRSPLPTRRGERRAAGSPTHAGKHPAQRHRPHDGGPGALHGRRAGGEP